MIEVYIWDSVKGPTWYGQKDSIGHASMLISYEDETACYGDYISWWPTGSVSDSPAYRFRSFQDDIGDEGRKPSKTYRLINILNESAALDYWKNWKKDLQYKLLTRNCSTTVLNILKSGGITDHITMLDLNPVTPDFVRSVCASLVTKLNRYPKLYLKPGMSAATF